jgi:non-canonical (house-cleaning) NTP pyrophosphatase
MDFSEITKDMHLDAPISIGVAGTSRLKKEAGLRAVHRINLYATVDLVDIPITGTNEQPVGCLEILSGAEARAKSARILAPNYDVCIGIENGIECIDGQWEDYAIISASFNRGKTRIVKGSEKCMFPTEAVLATQNLPGGFEKNTVGKYMASQGIVKSHDDPHIDLCGKSRIQILEDVIVDVLLEIFPKMR